jgi:hypothetical protein
VQNTLNTLLDPIERDHHCPAGRHCSLVPQWWRIGGPALAHPTRERRAPPAHRYVLRLGGVDRAVGQLRGSTNDRRSLERIGGFIARHIGYGALLFRLSVCTET